MSKEVAKKIKIHYICKDAKGAVLENTEEDGAPVVVEIGQEQLLPALETAYLQMKPGEERTLVLEPFEAFGKHQKDLVGWLDIDDLGLNDNEDLKPGMKLEVEDEEGQIIPAIILNVRDDCVQVDSNHPYAGKKLIFELKRVE
ncbi:MAG: FKBP-type peptidyl-prolyl cis-trans isomerase [Lentisphaeria bacterium]